MEMPERSIFPDTSEFFQSLARVFEEEPADAMPSSDRFVLASIGIEKGKPYEPHAATRTLLVEAAHVGSAMACRARAGSSICALAL